MLQFLNLIEDLLPKIGFDTSEDESFNFHDFSSLQGFNFHRAVVSHRHPAAFRLVGAVQEKEVYEKVHPLIILGEEFKFGAIAGPTSSPAKGCQRQRRGGSIGNS